MADDMTDSGRHSPFMTPPIMQTSIAVPNAVLTDASDVIRGLSGALMILQQDFEQRKIQLALEEINTTLETDDEEGLIYLSDNHVHQLVFTALDHFPDSLAIQQVGLEVLYLLCKKTKTLLQTSVSYKHIHSFLVKRLDVFKGDQYVQEKCLKILAEFLLLETFRCYLFEKGLQYDLFERVSHALLVFSEAPGVTKAAMEVIKNCICHKAEVQAIMAANSFVQNGLFTIMDVFKLTGNVQKSGLKMIETLVPQILDMSQSKADETARLIIKAVYTAMSIHVDQAHVQVAGCRTLSIVLEYRPSGHMWIGDSQDQKQDPVHNLVVGALLTYRKEAEVFVAACEAIFWIAADNEPLCTSLMNKNVHVAIIDGLRRHRKLARAVETGCRAIRGLCIFLYDHKVSVVGDGLFSVLTDLQGRYSDDGAVQIEVLSAIACLADVNVVRYQCFIERIPEKIISSMAKFPRESMIQEAGLEAFAVLAGAEGGPEMLLNCGALEATLNTLNNALNNIPLTDYTESKGLLSEACVAIQLLVESDKEISHSFIETDCHHRLFELLDNEFAGVQAVASECLYVLSQEQNLKSAMLLSACKKGTLSGVLDLHTPLNLSLEQGTDVVTGLLLQEIGYDRENIEENVHLEWCRLFYFDASENAIDDLSTFVSEDLREYLTNLETVDLHSNKIRCIPNDIYENLPQLTKVDLSSNDIGEFPVCLLHCKFLKEVRLSRNKITRVGEFGQDTPANHSLRHLDMSRNELDKIPDTNKVCTLPPTLNLPSLRTLDLAHNHVERIEHTFLSTLRVLDICENDLNGLPPLLMWKSRTMKDFIASSNNITKLDLKDAKVWSKLEKLHLAKNDIAEIPKEIGYCTCLNSLDISHNVRIRSLPDELGKCSRLYELNITKLELDINKSVLRGRVKDIISYLHNRLKKAQRYYRMKLMVVGYGGRGKTSLLKTLMKIKTNEREDRPTVGVVVKDWVYFKMDRKKSEDNSVWFKGGARKVEYTLSTWDFAGQEDFYSTHSCYLSNRAVYLVVFDLRKGVSEVEKLKSWLVSIRSRAPGCPVIVIGTHLDKLSDESRHGSTLNDVRDVLIEFNQEPGFPTIKKAFYVDASSDDENMEQLRNYIKETVNNLDIRGRRVMGEKIPASYVHLADVLLAKAKSPTCIYPVLDKKDLLKMVNEQDIDLDEDELDQAIRFLHEAGVVLHYDDSTLQLRDYYFIDPGWLCELMARIITVKQINPFISGNGILGKKEIKVLFKDIKEFPAKLIPQYIKLLEKLPFAPIGLVFRLIARMISIFSSEDFHSEMFSSEKQLVWRRGVYSFWKEEKYILLAYEPRDGNKMECIQITVPATKQGVKLLCRAVDEIDSLIDEWYPGLTSIDPIKGQPVLEVLTPCTQCIGTDADKHLFSINYLQKAASEDDIVRCPLHGGEVALSELAPDLILGDIEDEFKLEQNAFTFDELPSNQLGDGSFGGVFKGEYKGQTVAVKLFKEIADVHSVKMLRQEATILQSLCHPSVVALLAVGVRPPLIVIEYAAHGTLASLVKEGGEHNKRDIRQLKHKIAMQVNAKIADYGIARFTALQGLCAQEGTPGFRAPEVINKENYSFQADIFSFGLTLFVLLTGKHPFQYMDSSMEMDRALSERRQIPPPETHTTHTWPDMQQVIMACLKYDPDTRPTTDNLWDTLRKPEIHGVHKVITVSRSTTVECLAVEEREGKHGLRLWIASGDSESFQLSFSDLSDPSSKTRGVFFNHGRVLCMLSLGYSRLAIGTQLGRVWLFDTTDETYKTLHSSLQMEGSVLCMTYCKRKTNDDTLLVGLANGRIALLPVQELIQEPNRELVCLYPGEDYEPVKCMVRQGTRVYVTCGSQVLVLNTERGFVFDKIIETGERHPSAPAIHSLAVVKSILILSKRSSTVVEVWDMHSEKQSHTVDLVKACGIPNTEARITAMSADQRSIWVGTHGGYICIIDIMTLKMVMVTRRYTQAVRSLEHVNSSGPLKHRAVFSGGLGYVDVFQDTKGKMSKS
ncbi:LRRK2-like protein [Mya arenaria]|uniref:non-specific serine/threonine protein kinase n=1 Tax=Mya arenaria TaxID=6604 RepID=A0ABY7FZJ5_MYAAR|nr:LRRK2-like protein [Mya arenaria]